MKAISMKRRIFMVMLGIIFLAFLLILIAFNFFGRYYIRSQTTEQMSVISDSIKDYMSNMSKDHNGLDEKDVASTKIIQAISYISQTEKYTVNIDFVVFKDDMSIIYPREYEELNTTLEEIKKVIINMSNNNREQLNNENVFSLNIFEGTQDYAQIINLNKYYSVANGYVLIYSSTGVTQSFFEAINYVFILILVIIGLIMCVLSVGLASNISSPIRKLSSFARNIGRGKFENREFGFKDKEFIELADTMNNMVSKLAKYDAEQKTFFQNVSHEIRTPLMSIQGYAEGIKYGVIDDVSKSADVILEESERLTSMIKKVLYISRIDSEVKDEFLSVIDIRSVIEEVEYSIKGMQMKFDKEIVSELPAYPIEVKGNGEELCTAFSNILSNGLRYAKRKIEISIKDDENNVYVSIKDDGPGIDEKDIDNLFLRFYKGNQGNFGLGLSIVKTVIDKHKGNITVENDNGAKFTVILKKYKQQ